MIETTPPHNDFDNLSITQLAEKIGTDPTTLSYEELLKILPEGSTNEDVSALMRRKKAEMHHDKPHTRAGFEAISEKGVVLHSMTTEELAQYNQLTISELAEKIGTDPTTLSYEELFKILPEGSFDNAVADLMRTKKEEMIAQNQEPSDLVHFKLLLSYPNRQFSK